MKFESTDEFSPLLECVKSLWRQHSEWLGFFPDGAFKEYASKRRILVAVTEQNVVAGYVAFRPSPGQKISIVHLCIDPKFRSQGIAKGLISELSKRSNGFRGLGLQCRNDFPASKIWPRLGFVAIREQKGKSKEGHLLTFWWLDHKLEDLLSLPSQHQNTSLRALLDANVFFDLYDQSNPESAGLQVDWLLDETTFLVSPELLNEISRSKDHGRREDCRLYFRNFEQISAKVHEVDAAVAKLNIIFKTPQRIQDRSDIRQLAWAIAGGIKFFITRDDNILAKSDAIYENTSVSILRPSEFITQIDALLHEGQYQRDRLAGTRLQYGRDQIPNESELALVFQCSEKGEKKNEFLERIRSLKSQPDSSTCITVRDEDDLALGILGYRRDRSDAISVILARGRTGTLHSSVLRYLLSKALIDELDSTSICTITDPFFDEAMKTQITPLGFVDSGGHPLKIILRGCLKISEAIRELTVLAELHTAHTNALISIRDALAIGFEKKDISAIAKIEKILWPLEFEDSEIPCFIISIRPKFAQHLFDHEIASADMFGANIDLAMNQEAIYYRSPRNSGGLQEPGRLLWYVSQEENIPQSGELRSASSLEEVSVQSAKNAYRQFRRFGVFSRHDVIKIAKGDPESNIMALRFSGSLPLKHKIVWKDLQTALKEHGIKSTLLSPVKIPSKLYFQLRYQK